jgi:hypothetical protein
MKSDVVHGVVFEQEKELQKMMRSYIPFYNQKRKIRRGARVYARRRRALSGRPGIVLPAISRAAATDTRAKA